MRWRVHAANETSRPTEQTFQSTGPDNGSVEPKVEAMGSKEAKIRSTQPSSDRLASFLRPIRLRSEKRESNPVGCFRDRHVGRVTRNTYRRGE